MADSTVPERAPDGAPPQVAGRSRSRVVLAVLVGVTLAAALYGGVRPLWRGGRTADARWRHIERDVRERLSEAFADTTRTAGELAKRPELARVLASGDDRQTLFEMIERRVEHPAPSLAVTIFDAAGNARAWHGRPSELSGIAVVSPAGSAATATALGFRIVRFEPIVDPASSRRLGTVVVEQVLSEARAGNLASDAFRFSSSGGQVILRPAGIAAPPPDTRSFTFAGADGEPLIVAASDDDTLEASIRADERRARAALLVVIAACLILATGRLVDALARPRRAAGALLAAAGIAALLVVARLLLWYAAPGLWPSLNAPHRQSGWGAIFLRSPADLLLTAALLLALAALVAGAATRARAVLRPVRQWPAHAPLAFGLTQIVVAAIAAGFLAGCDLLLARSVALTGVDPLSLSLHPWSLERWVSLAGVIALQSAALWFAVSVLSLALARWRVGRRSPAAGAVLALWALSAGLIAYVATRAGAQVSLSYTLAVAIAFLAGVLAPRVVTRYRRAGASTRLLAFAAAFLVPALLAYPALLAASERMTRSLVESRYSQEALRHSDELLDALYTTLKEIDRLDELPRLVRGDISGSATERAFIVWSQTALARQRLTSSLELYGADRRLVSRFALNFPEYEATAQPARNERCTWQVVGEARAFGAEERVALHAERALCGAGGDVTGAVIVHVMLDYNALPFISPESPYREVLRTDASARNGSHSRQIALAIYGWSLLPIYASGVQVWPIDEARFARIYASREGFWTRVTNRGETWHVYFVNDRSGIYAIGYPALKPIDHLVHLGELTALAALFYLAGLAVMAVFNRVARARHWTGRALLRDIRASFYRKLLIAFVAAAVIPVLALALVIRTYFATRLRADVNAEAARTAIVAQHALEELAALLRLAGLSAPPINDDLMVEVSQMIGRDVNVFEGASLLATSQRDLFASGLLPTRTPEDVYREIILRRQPTFVGEDEVGSLRYLVAAAPVGATGREAIVTVPLASRQQEIEREIDELDRGLLLAVLLFMAVGAGIGLPTAERIADPVRRLTRASRRIARGDFDTRVAVRSIDELRRLVDAFNQMAAELKTQRQQLERTHRLEAWAEMARQVAHEIKNPLTPIQLSAEHLRRVHADRGEPLSPVLDSCVESILGQVHLLRQIAGEFSSFASSPTARLSRVNVAALLEDVIAPYRTGLDGRIAIHVDAPPTLPDVTADRVLVARALTNILENALHAMPGRGSLHITASEEPGYVSIAVRDTGAGMDDAALARVFEPYFSTKAAGTGLGLTIAARNVELSGGTIGVTSKKGDGTTVTIRLQSMPNV